MPFTFSHPAAVLPLLRRDTRGALRGRGPLVAAGLVAGSLAPDVPFFLDSLVPGVYRHGRLAHRASGVALADPLIAAGLAAFWAAAREPVTGLLPPRLAVRAGRPREAGGPVRWGAREAGWFWVSAAAGAATHVVWDAFTHDGRWGVRLVPALNHEVRRVPLHHWAQYATSAAGLATVGTRVLRADQAGAPVTARFPRSPATRRAAVTAIGACTLAAAVARCRRDREPARGGLSGLIASATFGGGAGLAAAVAAWTAAVRVRGRASRADR